MVRLRRPACWIGWCLAAIVLCASPAWAIWAPVPIEILLDEAQLVIAGKVTRLEDSDVKIGERPQQMAVIAVDQVLKSLPGLGDPGEIKEVHLAQPAPGGVAISIDIRYDPEQAGVWLLSKDPKSGVYRITHPSQFQPQGEQAKLAELIAARAKLPSGKEVAGLVARAELVDVPMPDGASARELRLSLLNVSDEPIAVCQFAAHQPLKLAWIGPDGQRRASNHYVWLKRSLPMELTERDFVTIAPGGVRHIGPMSNAGGIVFLPADAAPDENANVAEAGAHKVTVGFASAEDGAKFKLKNVWTGKIAANTLTFEAE